MGMIGGVFTGIAQSLTADIELNFGFILFLMWTFTSYLLVIVINTLQFAAEKQGREKVATRLWNTYYSVPRTSSEQPLLKYVVDYAVIILLLPATFCLIVQKKVVDNRLKQKQKREESESVIDGLGGAWSDADIEEIKSNLEDLGHKDDF